MTTADPTLAPTAIIDSDHPEVVAFAARYRGAGTLREQAVRLYYAVRDEIRYDPYSIALTAQGLSASQALAWGRGWCVSKAALLAACCRASGIPARVGFADVKNHLSTERMRATMQTDEFVYHGYTLVGIEDQWVKATPAFNLSLCEKFRIRPLEFDGAADSIYHPFDLDGRQHMEYLRYRGEYDDVPLADMVATFNVVYPHMLATLAGGDFDQEVARETGSNPRPG